MPGADVIRARFPAYNRGNDVYVDGYLNPRSGWAQSGRVVTKLLEASAAQLCRRYICLWPVLSVACFPTSVTNPVCPSAKPAGWG